MALNLIDRILTVVVTATLTSAVWIVAGGSLMQYAGEADDDAAPASEDAAQGTSASAANVDPDASSDRVPISNSLDSVASSSVEAEARDLIVPVLNVGASELSDTFTDERSDGERLHEAIDIMAPRGTTVIAASAGTIEKLFRSDAGGNTIYVRSRDGRTIYYYAHLDKYAQGLKDGQRIRRGQRLGEVGSTGNASEDAPHLHFAILRTTADADWWEPANAVNPYPLLSRRAR